eukprot:114921_1
MVDILPRKKKINCKDFMTYLSALENEYKQKFEIEFNNYINSNQHTNQIMDLYCKQMLNQNRNDAWPTFVALGIKYNDLRKYVKKKFDYLINNGTQLVVLNNKDRVVSTNGLLDLVHNIYNDEDMYSKSIERWRTIERNIKHKQKDVYFKNDKTFQEIADINYYTITDANLRKLYGKYYTMGWGSTLPAYSGQGLMFISMNVLFYVASKMNYCKIFGFSSTPSQMRKMKLFYGVDMFEYKVEIEHGTSHIILVSSINIDKRKTISGRNTESLNQVMINAFMQLINKKQRSKL